MGKETKGRKPPKPKIPFKGTSRFVERDLTEEQQERIDAIYRFFLFDEPFPYINPPKTD